MKKGPFEVYSGSLSKRVKVMDQRSKQHLSEQKKTRALCAVNSFKSMCICFKSKRYVDERSLKSTVHPLFQLMSGKASKLNRFPEFSRLRNITRLSSLTVDIWCTRYTRAQSDQVALFVV